LSNEVVEEIAVASGLPSSKLIAVSLHLAIPVDEKRKKELPRGILRDLNC
jgi:hypothetical protein